VSPAPSFELLRLVALPAGAEIAVVELEGRLGPAAARAGGAPRALKPRLLLEDDEGRLDISAASCDVEGRILRATFAVPTSRLADAALAVGLRDVLFDLPAPDTIPGAEREIALAREANGLRRELHAARAELAAAAEEREAALAEVRREEEERLAAAELLIAREREEAAARQAALAAELETARREAEAREEAARAQAAEREEAARTEADAREQTVRAETQAREEAIREDAGARLADLEAELDAARSDADAREARARSDAETRLERLRAEMDARMEELRAELRERSRAPSPDDPLGAGPPPPAVGLPDPRVASDPMPTPDLPTIRPSTAAGRGGPPGSPPRRPGSGDLDWEDQRVPRPGGLFDEPYDPAPDPPPGGGGEGGSVLADPDDELDEDATAPQPLRRVRRTGEPVPPRSQAATQVRARPGAPGDDAPDPRQASAVRYIVLAFVALAILLVVLAIAAL
jgi:chemotaxis protein histidine kinase CheA